MEGSKQWKDDALGSTIYQSGGANNKLGNGIIVLGKMRDRVMDWTAINDRMCRLGIGGRVFNYHISNVHCPHEETPNGEKKSFYAKL